MSKVSNEQWNELMGQFNALLASNANVLESFRVRMTTLFAPLEVAARKRADGPFKRKPPISLRLIMEGEQPSKLVVLPHHLVRGHRDQRIVTLDCSRLDCELFDTNAAGKSHVRFKMRLSPCKANVNRWSWKTAINDANRAIGTMRDFVTDRRKVLARSHDHCCVCGRHLTDELSRSRGIGPECIQGCYRFLEPEELVREMTVEDVFREEIRRHPEDTTTQLIAAFRRD
jgi:hypothetical protein